MRSCLRAVGRMFSFVFFCAPVHECVISFVFFARSRVVICVIPPPAARAMCVCVCVCVYGLLFDSICLRCVCVSLCVCVCVCVCLKERDSERAREYLSVSACVRMSVLN